jgi:hypothetical protein
MATQISYYDLVVSVAREKNNPRVTKKECRDRLVTCFKTCNVPFIESAFNAAYKEFNRVTATMSRMVYGITTPERSGTDEVKAYNC